MKHCVFLKSILWSVQIGLWPTTRRLLEGKQIWKGNLKNICNISLSLVNNKCLRRGIKCERKKKSGKKWEKKEAEIDKDSEGTWLWHVQFGLNCAQPLIGIFAKPQVVVTLGEVLCWPINLEQRKKKNPLTLQLSLTRVSEREWSENTSWRIHLENGEKGHSN